MGFMKNRLKRRGDTLIEVTLAVGIFSMVAVAVVAVVSGSTSSAQTALETTVTREEIDTQAEALRFIQSSYIAGGLTNAAGNRLYVKLWNEIISHANNLTSFDTETNNFLEYMPSTCTELYDTTQNNNIFKQKAFIINTHKMYLLSAASRGGRTDEELVAQIVTPAVAGNGVFQAAATYPRIVYNSALDDDSVYGQSVGENIQYVEGLYVVAVKDSSAGTSVVGGASATVSQKSAYYDFYIRTCWFGPGAERPSTISTVIRLYDPEAITY